MNESTWKATCVAKNKYETKLLKVGYNSLLKQCQLIILIDDFNRLLSNSTTYMIGNKTKKGVRTYVHMHTCADKWTGIQSCIYNTTIWSIIQCFRHSFIHSLLHCCGWEVRLSFDKARMFKALPHDHHHQQPTTWITWIGVCALSIPTQYDRFYFVFLFFQLFHKNI